MNRAWIIAVNDLRLFLRHKTSYIWLFGVPLAFTYFLGFANRGPGSPANPRPAVLIENRDRGFIADALLRELDTQKLKPVPEADRAQAGRGLRLPDQLTERVMRRRPAKIQFFATEDAAAADSALVEARLLRALVMLNSHLIEASRLRPANAPLDPEALREVQGRANPVGLDATFAGRKPVPAGFGQSLPGMLVMSLLMNLLIFGGATMADDRRSGVLRRLATYPLRPGGLGRGKINGLILLGLVQSIVFVLLGQFVFGVRMGANVFGVLVVLAVFCWAAAAMGVFLGSVIASEDKIVAVCVLASMIMAAIGGCWWPLEVVPTWLRTAAHFFPTAWAMDALHQLISYGNGLAQTQVLKPLAVLVAVATAAHLAAAKYFRL